MISQSSRHLGRIVPLSQSGAEVRYPQDDWGEEEQEGRLETTTVFEAPTRRGAQINPESTTKLLSYAFASTS